MVARPSPAASEPGFRGPTVHKLVGITYRQLDYWARTDVVELRIIKRLLDAGVSLRQIRDAIGYLRKESGGKPLSDITLMSDGNRIYACHSNEEVVDVLSNGQAVFGIAVGRVWADTEGDLAHLPGDQPGGAVVEPDAGPATGPAVADASGGVPPRAAPQGTQG